MPMTTPAKPRLTSLAPQFLVDDLERAIAYYRDALGFSFGQPWGGFYAIGRLDGVEIHLKEAPKNPAERKHRRENEHLDASAGVEGSRRFTSNVSRAGPKSSNRWPRPSGGRRIFTLKTRTATSSASAGRSASAAIPRAIAPTPDEGRGVCHE